MKEKNKSERFSKIREFLKTKAPDLLHKAGEFLPSFGYLGVLKNVILSATQTELNETDRKQAIEIINKEFETFSKELEDLHDARLMQIEALKSDDKFSKRFIYYLATFVMISATGFGIALTIVEIPPANRRLIEMFADIYLFAGAIMVLQFFFGASHSLRKKQE